MPAKSAKIDDPGSQEMIKKLGDRIKSIRKAKGYNSYEAFANDHTIHRAQFGRYEKGENIEFVTLLTIVKDFDMTLKEFFSEGF